MTQLLAVDAERSAGSVPPMMAFQASRAAPHLAPAPEPPAPLRCRLGLHRWLPLALSVHGASAGLSVAFCRDCPRVRRPARLG